MKFKSNIKKIFASLCSSVFLFSLVNVNALQVDAPVTASTTAEEKNAVENYMNRGYIEINQELREGKKTETSKGTDLINKISSFINKNNCPVENRPEHLYRGISSCALANMLSKGNSTINLDELKSKIKIKEKIILTEKGFMSTSSNINVALEFTGDNIILIIKKCEDDCNCKCAKLGGKEYEYLFDPGQKLLINEIDKEKKALVYTGMVRINCEIVHE